MMKYISNAAGFFTGKGMRSSLKGLLLGCLAVAVIIAAQMGLSVLVGFRTAEIVGKTVCIALFWYCVIRVIHVRREARS